MQWLRVSQPLEMRSRCGYVSEIQRGELSRSDALVSGDMFLQIWGTNWWWIMSRLSSANWGSLWTYIHWWGTCLRWTQSDLYCKNNYYIVVVKLINQFIYVKKIHHQVYIVTIKHWCEKLQAKDFIELNWLRRVHIIIINANLGKLNQIQM